MGDTNAMAAAFEEALKSGDFNRTRRDAPAVRDRRLRRRVPAVRRAPLEAGPDPDGRDVREGDRDEPDFSYKRMLGGGDVFVVEGTIDYGDGVPVRYVGIGEVRDGKVAKMTEYFANPFDAPAWRADFVERMEPTTA